MVSDVLQYGGSSDEISLATVIERDSDRFSGRIGEGLAYGQADPSVFTKPGHLGMKGLQRKDVAYVTRFGLDQRPAGQLQFVIHEKNDGWRSH
jgi:hypothetical protein